MLEKDNEITVDEYERIEEFSEKETELKLLYATNKENIEY